MSRRRLLNLPTSEGQGVPLFGGLGTGWSGLVIGSGWGGFFGAVVEVVFAEDLRDPR